MFRPSLAPDHTPDHTPDLARGSRPPSTRPPASRLGACLALCAALLGGCATQAPAPAPPEAARFFRDATYAPPSERIDAGQVFALSDAMKRYVHFDIAYQLRRDGPRRGLIKALYKPGGLKLEYDAAMTRNPAQAFEAGRGNCLSLVIMTAAFAKELNLPVTYQSVDIGETWSRENDIAFLNGHVNVTLGTRTGNTGMVSYDEYRTLTVDFLPAEDIFGQRTRPISEATVVAMFLNNRAAEALAAGRVDDAYWWARAAVRQSPDFLPGFNTLGVTHLHHGDAPAAEAAFMHVLASRPDDRQALSNLATALDRQSRGGEAADARTRLARLEADPPFKFFRLGIDAMRRAEYANAKAMFEKEVARAGYNAEFHFWLGVAHLRLGDLEQARKQMAIAMENSTTRDSRELYAAKLDHLRALRTQ